MFRLSKTNSLISAGAREREDISTSRQGPFDSIRDPNTMTAHCVTHELTVALLAPLITGVLVPLERAAEGDDSARELALGVGCIEILIQVEIDEHSLTAPECE